VRLWNSQDPKMNVQTSARLANMLVRHLLQSPEIDSILLIVIQLWPGLVETSSLIELAAKNAVTVEYSNALASESMLGLLRNEAVDLDRWLSKTPHSTSVSYY
jgi:hypothetical protein